MMIRFRIWENQSTLLQENIHNREEAIEIARKHHIIKPNKYHEVYRYTEEDKTGWGICQWKPGDDEHGRPKEEGKFNADKIYNLLVPCHKNPILLCHVRIQPNDCPPHCEKLAVCDER